MRSAFKHEKFPAMSKSSALEIYTTWSSLEKDGYQSNYKNTTKNHPKNHPDPSHQKHHSITLYAFPQIPINSPAVLPKTPLVAPILLPMLPMSANANTGNCAVSIPPILTPLLTNSAPATVENKPNLMMNLRIEVRADFFWR